MRMFHRAVATTVASLAFATAGIVAAVPASATPEDGKGCIGLKDAPVIAGATYVCVISVTPENVVPTTTTTSIPVTVPSLCYFLDCTKPTTVNVPVPGVTPKAGVVATLWYQGTYYPIAVGTVDAMKLLADTIDLANGVVTTAIGIAVNAAEYGVAQANYYVGVAGQVVDNTEETVNRELDEAGQTIADARENVEAAVARELDDLRETIENLPTLQELVDAIIRLYEQRVAPVVDNLADDINRIREGLEEDVAVLVARVTKIVQDCLRECFAIMELPEVPDVKEIIGRVEIGDIISPME